MIGDIASFRQYAIDRGYAEPRDDTDGRVRAALVRASDYIESTYPHAYALASARNDVERATYIAALRELEEPGFWVKVWTEGERKVLTEVGDAIKWTLPPSGATGSGHMSPRSNVIDGLLGKYEIAAMRCYPNIMTVG